MKILCRAWLAKSMAQLCVAHVRHADSVFNMRASLVTTTHLPIIIECDNVPPEELPILEMVRNVIWECIDGRPIPEGIKWDQDYVDYWRCEIRSLDKLIQRHRANAT